MFEALAVQKDTVDMLTIFISALGGAGIALGVAWYFSKKFLDLQIKKTIQKYQFELDQKSTALKTELSIYAHEQSVGLSRLDAQRSDAIKEIYESMMHWHDLYIEIFKPIENKYPSPVEKKQQYYDWSTGLVKVADGISVQVRKHAIYFEQSSYAKIAKFGQEATTLSCDLYDETFGKVDISTEEGTERLFQLIESVRNSHRDLPTSLVESRQLLISEFRVLMKAEKSRHD